MNAVYKTDEIVCYLGFFRVRFARVIRYNVLVKEKTSFGRTYRYLEEQYVIQFANGTLKSVKSDKII